MLAAFTGSAAGAVAGAVTAAGVVFAVSLFGASAGVDGATGAVAVVSAGFVSAGFGSEVFAVARGSSICLGGTDAVASNLKSSAVGGGTLAGCGRGIAASIASSAALARGVSDWASADVAETARNVAATAIKTRSNPARFFEQSRIVTPPWAKLSRQRDSSNIVCHSLRESAGLDPSVGTPARNESNADDTCALAEQGATHDKLT